MFPAARSTMPNFGIIREILVSPWHRKQWCMIPVLFIISLYLLLLQFLVTFSSLAKDLLTLKGRIRAKRLQRKIDEEGRNMYPLW